ncbi:MAG: hypothetical protein NTZ55_05895 [Candidatus Roizmanbacteria bacterium]|nr:hypothetical protein [Candidatus Roizmanbacteria bacterium]
MSHPFQTEEYRTLFKKHFISNPQTCVVVEDIEYELLPDKRAVLVGMKPVLGSQEISDYGIESISNIETIHKSLIRLYPRRQPGISGIINISSKSTNSTRSFTLYSAP